MKNNHEIYIIAEAGVNHNGSIDIAERLIDAAAKAGADAVKFQTFKAKKLVSKDAPKAEYQIRTTGSSDSQFDMIKKLELDELSHRHLIQYCRSRCIQFLSTPFDEDSLVLLAYTLDLPVIKIPSGEITNGPLLLKASRTLKPIILSTGMSTLSDVEAALEVLAFGYSKSPRPPCRRAFQESYRTEEAQKLLKQNITLLHCTTEYPASYDDVNLMAMETLSNAFDLRVGYSDHTPGIEVALAAAARGAVVIEKHFTLDRNLPGPDHKASLEPVELDQLVSSVRNIKKALGGAQKMPVESELKNMTIARKSIVAAVDIKQGEKFTIDNLAVKRPGTGISPMLFWDLLNTESTKNYKADEVIK